MTRKSAHIGRPRKRLVDLHVRISRESKRELELRAQEEHKELGALVEEGLRLLEDRRAELPAQAELQQAINERLASLMNSPEVAEGRRRQREILERPGPAGPGEHGPLKSD